MLNNFGQFKKTIFEGLIFSHFIFAAFGMNSVGLLPVCSRLGEPVAARGSAQTLLPMHRNMHARARLQANH